MSKYWWRDEDDTEEKKSKEKQQSTSNKYWWRDEADTGNEQSGQQSSKDKYWWRDEDYYSYRSNQVGRDVSNRVNTWLENHNSYVTDYKNRYSGRKGNYEDSYVSDAGSWLDTVKQRKTEYDAEADSILQYIEQNKSLLDKDWVKKVTDTITGARSQQGSIVDIATQDNDWWSNFGSEDLVKEYGSAEEAYKYYQRDDGYRKKYGGKKYSELQEMLDGLDDGEEKDWLTAYSAGVDYDEKKNLDTVATLKEIKAMEAELEQYKNQDFDWTDNKARAAYEEGLDARETAISQKKAYLTQAQNIQNGVKLSGVADKESEYYDPEFTQYTGYVDGDKSFLEEYVPDYKDIAYDYVNDKASSSAIAMGTAWKRISGSERKRMSAIGQMTDDEVALYNYYYNKYGYDEAEEYLDSIIETLNTRIAQKNMKVLENKPILEMVFGMAAGLDQFESGIRNFLNTDDSYIPSSAMQITSGLVREDLGDIDLKWYNFKDGEWDNAKILGNSLGQGIYDTITTTANMAPSILASSLVGALNPAAGVATGNILMGASSAGNAYQEAINLGYDKGQARAYSTLVGASEVGLQYLLGGIGKLGGKMSGSTATKLAAKFDSAYARLAVKYGVNMLSEGTEEYLQEILTPVFKNLALKTDEEVELITEEAIYSFLLGSLTSGFMEGTGISSDTGKGVIGTLKDMSSNNELNIKAATQYGDFTKELIEEGLASDPNSESHQLAEMFARKTKDRTDKNGETVKGKSMTGYEIRQLVKANEAQFVVENYNEALPLAKKRLTELGETKNVDKIADLVAKRATGQQLTASEKSTLVKSQYGAKVAKEMTPATADLNYKSLEKRVGTNKNYIVSDNGKDTVIESGKEIDLRSAKIVDFIKDEETGQIVDMVLNANGEEVNASGIAYSDDSKSYLFEAVSKIENITPEDATVIVRDYDPASGLSVGEYLNGVDEAYTYGYNKYPEADLKAGNFATKLSNVQMMSAYELGKATKAANRSNKVENIKRMRTAVQAATEKSIAEGKAAPKAKGMTITYNRGNGEVVSIEDANIESEQRAAAPAVAKLLHDMNLGTSVEFFSSYITRDEHGNKIRVFLDDNGVEQKAYSGVYRKSDGTIRVDLEAYNGKGLALNALAHELTHFIQQWSGEKYDVLAEFLVKTYEKTDMTMHDRVLREQARLSGIRGKDVSYSEAYDEVVANAMSKMFDDGKLLERLQELAVKDKSLVEKILEGIKEFFNKFLKVYEKLPAEFHDAADIVAMKDTFEKLQNMFAEALVEASENFREAQAIGFEMDMETDSVSPAVMRSEQTWTESDYVQQRDKAAQEIAKAIGVTEKKAKDYIDSVNSIAKMIAEDRSRLDYFSSPGRSSFVDNAEYGGSFDFSTLCKKRRLLTGTFTAIQKALPNTALTADEILDIRNRMKKANLEVSCGLCYVEGSRANMGQFAKEFLRLYKEYYPDAWQPNMADVNTPDGIEWVRINHPECYEQYEYFWNHYGTLKPGDKNLFASQQKPKLYQLHTEYKGEILNKFKNDDKVEDKNLNGGIRLQSFSDFEIVHLIDTMQIIMDMSRVGLAGQAYTKVPDFAWALGDTGLKINLSLIAKGVDTDGRLIFDDVEGMPIAEAMKLRDRYSKNVGTILVAFNDEQLMAAMADDRVDFIIPFHRSQWKKSQYEAMGLPAKTKDYTFMQNEKFIKPQFHEYRGRMVKDKATNYMPNEYWDFSKTGKENAEAYLEMCARNNKRPKFYKLLDNNGDGSYSLKADGSTDGYWKLLIDFKMYDNEGNGSPQMAVKPDFNMEEATRMLNDYSGGHSNFPVAQGIVDSFVKDYKASHKGEQYSSHETDADSISVNDIVTTANGRLAVNINSRASGLHGHRKGEWPALVSGMIRKTLAGKSIIAEDGDIITVTRRGANEVGFGTDTRKLKTEAKATNNYSKVEQKMITAEHAASIIALSRYSSWSQNTEDPTDMFKRDGLNYRTVEMFIDGDPYVATVVTALNADPGQVVDYGDKFYDIESIEKQTNSPASYGTPNVGAAPHKIKMADSSSDRLTIAQKQRIVNRQNSTYSTGDTGTKTAMAEAFSRAKELKSTHETDYSNRSLLANAFEGITKSSAEYKLIQDYKGHIRLLNEYEEKLSKLNAEIYKTRFTAGKYDAKKLAQLEAEAKNVAKEINKHDRKLLSLEASEPLRKLIEQERKKEAQKTKAHVQEIQENKKVRAEQAEYRHKIRKAIRDLDKILNRGNKKLNVKEDMKGFASKALELADYLFTDHISNDELIRRGIDPDIAEGAGKTHLVKETEDILSQLYDHADSLTNEEFTRLDAKRKANEDKLRDVLKAQRNRSLSTPVYKLFNDIVTEYAKLKNSNQDAIKAAYNPEIERFLRSYIGEENGQTDTDRKTLLENMRVADMTTDELWKLHNAYKMILHSIRTANELFVKGKLESIEKTVEQITWDFSKRKAPEGTVATVARNLANKMGWDYEKLYYALDRIGSEAFTELVMNIANSENIVMQDVMEAALFRDQMVEKYGYNNWDVNKKIDREFLDNTGKKFNLTLGELMALYAYSRREGALTNLEYGGFVFGKAELTNPKPADSYKLNKEQCEAITSLLTKEQKAYAEDMQKYLSDVMGEKGNEVSMLMYGIKMFTEKNYFPVHIAGQFKAQASESQAKAAAGFSSMSNAGFTHAKNPNAKAPIVLEGFNDVWADHVNEMSRYHGTVPALEDMRRVMNRSSYSDANAESMAIKQLMENSYGKDAVEYFNNLYREANSGAITDKLQRVPKKLLSLFRKNSVAYSLSVLVQQPASIVRAYAMIDKKYFGLKGFGTITSGVAKAVSDKWTKAHTNAYNEMLKYAPGVTMAKEIGGFDTATGGSIRSYLLDTNKKFTQKMKTGTALEKGMAALDLVDNNAIANLPNLADKIAWIEIWNACKRETLAKHKDLAPNSDEFMKIVGDRFTEVIRATQVYDSIFSKSPMLKSKNLAVQMLVSFMNEPNTVANMAEKAIRDMARGNVKAGAKTAFVVVHYIIFTNVLKSIIYAMRDDDEDETYIEKYLEAVVGNMMDDFNALNYIPLVRDVWSVAQGYDVERTDMAIVSDAIGALTNVIKNATKDTEDMTEEELAEFDKKVTEAKWNLVESLSAFLGIPVKNIRREINGVLDHAKIASANAGKTTGLSAWDKVYDSVIGSIPFMQNKHTKGDKLYDAIMAGDDAYLSRLKSTYKTEESYHNAVRKALRENDSRIHEAAQARYDGNVAEYKRIFNEIKKEGNFSFDDIMSAINSEESQIRNKAEPDKATSDYTAGGFVEAIIVGDAKNAQAMREDIISTKVANGKSQEEAEKEFASDVATGIKNAYSTGLLDEAGAKNMLMEYAGKDEEDADSKVGLWVFCEENPKYDYFTESNVKDYREFAEPADISLDVFAQFINGTKGLETKYDKWGDVEVSKRDQVLEVIDSLPLTWQQKDALYLAAGYSESKIWDVPW